MSKHTSWPWVVVPRLSGSENHKGFRIAGDGCYIAEVMPLDADGIKGGANAGLIAAAPDLLEALMECRRVMMVEDSLNTAYGWAEHVAKHVDPVIAIATGETICSSKTASASVG